MENGFTIRTASYEINVDREVIDICQNGAVQARFDEEGNRSKNIVDALCWLEKHGVVIPLESLYWV